MNNKLANNEDNENEEGESKGLKNGLVMEWRESWKLILEKYWT
mgnify:CR=1 FL=1